MNTLCPALVLALVLILSLEGQGAGVHRLLSALPALRRHRGQQGLDGAAQEAGGLRQLLQQVRQGPDERLAQPRVPAQGRVHRLFQAQFVLGPVGVCTMPDEQISADMCVGIILFLSPTILEQEGAIFSCSNASKVGDNHFFVCIKSDNNKFFIVPIYSHSGDRRLPIPTKEISGHEKLRKIPTSYYHPDQVWSANSDCIIKAADAGGDLSRAGSRNILKTFRADIMRRNCHKSIRALETQP